MIFEIIYNINNASTIAFATVNAANIRDFVKAQCDYLKESTFKRGLSRATISIEDRDDEWVILFQDNHFSYIKNNGEASDRNDFCKSITSQKKHINGHVNI